MMIIFKTSEGEFVNLSSMKKFDKLGRLTFLDREDMVLNEEDRERLRKLFESGQLSGMHVSPEHFLPQKPKKPGKR